MSAINVRKGQTIRFRSSWDSEDTGIVILRRGSQVFMEGGKHCVIEEVLEIL